MSTASTVPPRVVSTIAVAAPATTTPTMIVQNHHLVATPPPCEVSAPIGGGSSPGGGGGGGASPSNTSTRIGCSGVPSRAGPLPCSSNASMKYSIAFVTCSAGIVASYASSTFFIGMVSY